MLLFYILFITAISNVLSKKYLCSLNDTVYLKENEIAFFESYQYPNSEAYHIPCQLNFSLANSNSRETLLIVLNQIIYSSFSNYHIDHTPDFHFLVLNESFYTLTPKKSDPNDCNETSILALQGFAINEDVSENCPLESLSIANPFELSDETEIIYIRSKYYENVFRNRSCKWRFSATNQYGFKIVIQALNVSPNTTFLVKNSTDYFIGKDMINLNHAYFNEDNYIEIFLSQSNNENFFTDEPEFQAYISVVKKLYEIIDAKCTLSIFSFSTFWGNNITYGYKNNARCSHGEVIPPNGALYVYVNMFGMEKYIDYLKYDIDGQNATKIFERCSFVIEGYTEDNSMKYVWFEFISDGSLQFSGFQIQFHPYQCKCTASPVKCSDTEFGIMDGTYQYCGNLHCNLTLEPCKANRLIIDVKMAPEDIFKFQSNNETVLEINVDNALNEYFIISFNPNNIITLEAITSSSEFMREFSMTWYTINPSSNIKPKITLSESKPNYIIMSDQNEVFAIEMSQQMAEKNSFFTLHINMAIYAAPILQLYSNKNFTAYLSTKNCFTKESPYKCIVHAKEFVAAFHPLNDNLFTVLAIQLPKKIKGCIFEENIFVANGEKQSIVGIANSEDECMIQLLVEEVVNSLKSHYIISHLFTTATTENVEIYAGMDKTFLLFKFNSKTLKNWKNIGLFSSIYTIYIPRNSAFFMTVSKYSLIQPFVIDEYPFNSIVTSSYFGTLELSDDLNDGCLNEISSYDMVLYHFYIGLKPVKFTVIHSVLPDDSLTIDLSPPQINFKRRPTVTLKDQSLRINLELGSSTIFQKKKKKKTAAMA